MELELELERLRTAASAQRPHQVGLLAVAQVGLSRAPPWVGTLMEGWMQVWGDWAPSGERGARLPRRQAEPRPMWDSPGFALRTSMFLEKGRLCPWAPSLAHAKKTVVQYSVIFCSSKGLR